MPALTPEPVAPAPRRAAAGPWWGRLGWEHGVLLLVLALAAWLGLGEHEQLTYGSDVRGYLEPLHYLLQGKGYPNAHFPPGVGVMAYPFYILSQNIPYSGMLSSLVHYLAAVVLGFALARRVGGPWAGAWAALLVAATPNLLEAAGIGMSEAPFTAWLLLSLWLWLRLLERTTQGRGGWALHLGLGAALGWLYLIRPEGFLIGLLVTAVVILRALVLWRRLPWGRELVLKALACGLVFALLSGAYIGFLKAKTGRLAISGKTGEVFHEYGGMVTYGLNDASHTRDESILGYILANPRLFTYRVLFNLKETLRRTPSLILHAVVPLALLWLLHPLAGVRRLAWPRPPGPETPPRAARRRHWWLLATLAIYLSPLAVLLAFNVSDRYLLSFAVLLAVVTAVLLEALRATYPQTWRPWLAGAGLLLCALVLTGPGHPTPAPLKRIFPTYQSLWDVAAGRHGSSGFAAAGRWLAAHSPIPARDLRLMGPLKGHVAITFADDLSRPLRVGGNYLPVCDKDLDEIAARLKSGQQDYLVLDFFHSQEPDCQALTRLWRDPGLAASHGLRLVHQDPRGWFMIFAAPK